MSKIQGKPFIEKVIQSLTDTLRTDLVSLINGADQSPAFRSLINANHYISADDKNKVSHVVLETWNKTYTGYLIYTDDFCVVISYNRNTQDLDILTINLTNQSYKIVREPLTITELRFVLQDSNGDSISNSIEVSNITTLTDDEINFLKPGYEVIKKTGNQRHTYLVSYKENGQGICLTYTDASVVETVSYDYSGGHWVYNSTDVTPLGSGGMENPMTAANDLIIGGSNGTPTRLGVGTAGQVLKVNSDATGIEWATVPESMATFVDWS